MNIVQIIVTLFVVGLLLWALNRFPLEPWVKNLINVIMVVVVCLWLLRALGFSHYLPGLR